MMTETLMPGGGLAMGPAFRAVAEQLNLAEPIRRSQPEVPTTHASQAGSFEDIL